MEEGAILVVVPRFVNFLIPYYASLSRLSKLELFHRIKVPSTY
jgi:hypothetical protein